MSDSSSNGSPKNAKLQISADTFMTLLGRAAQLPGVRIDRESYLRSSLMRHCTAEQVEMAIDFSPVQAKVPQDVIARAAKASINFETSKVTALSAAAGIPGGIAMIGTISADLTQYLAHVLRITQKLAYLNSWPDLFTSEDGEIDDATKNTLLLFLGSMFGAQTAQNAIKSVSTRVATELARRLPQQALTKGVVYPAVKTVAKYMGVQMTKTVFAGGVAKAVPIAGAVLSGGLTLGIYSSQSKRLQRYLSALSTADPDQAIYEDESLGKAANDNTNEQGNGEPDLTVVVDSKSVTTSSPAN